MKVQATYTTDYRGNATDARTRERLNGKQAVAVTLTRTGDKTRYISRETWESETTIEQAAKVYTGKSNNNMLRYQCVIETPNPSKELHANMLASNGNTPLWYATANGYCSPSFANARWHDKLTNIFEFVESATITIVITDETTGALFDTVSVSGNRDKLGRFVKKDETGKYPLLVLIDKATERRKGYRNHADK